MTKITELLDSKESLRVMALLPPQNDLIPQKLSLFERFSLICENLYLLKNNLLGKSFLELLVKELGVNLSFDGSVGCESQKQIWRALCMPCADKVDICIDVEARKYSIDTVDLGESLDIRSYILSSDIKELDVLISELINSNFDSIYFDISQASYVRPDPYHAELAYKDAQGSSITEDEMSMLVSWVICRALMQKRLDIYLRVDHTVDQAIRFIELLRSRGIAACVCVIISASEIPTVDKIAGGLFATAESNVSIGISTDNEKLLNVASLYFPLNKINQFTI